MCSEGGEEWGGGGDGRGKMKGRGEQIEVFFSGKGTKDGVIGPLKLPPLWLKRSVGFRGFLLIRGGGGGGYVSAPTIGAQLGLTFFFSILVQLFSQNIHSQFGHI